MRTTKAGFIERAITFGYDFRMRCDACVKASYLPGADYIRHNNEAGAHMDCDHCDNSIHFGPLVADIRDPDDLALDDSLVNKAQLVPREHLPDVAEPGLMSRTSALPTSRQICQTCELSSRQTTTRHSTIRAA